MANEKNAVAQTAAKVESNAINEAGAKGQNLLALKPKSSVQVGFLYRNSSDLRALIGFVGSRPVINEEGEIQYKKNIIKDGSVVFRTEFGTIDRVLSPSQVSDQFDLAASHPYGPEYAATPKAKVIKAKDKVKKEK